MKGYEIADLLRSINNSDTFIDNITINSRKRLVYGDLKINRTRTTLSYMEPGTISFCTHLATELRNITGKNAYFDIRHGRFILFF